MRYIKIIYLIGGILLLSLSSFVANDIFKTSSNDTDLNSLVNQYNEELISKYGKALKPIQKGFISNGSIEADIIKEENEQYLLGFFFREYDSTGTIINLEKFNLEFDGYFKFPDKIGNAQVTFLGNQIVITDTDNDFRVNLFVDTGEGVTNKTPNIETLMANSIIREKISDLSTVFQAPSCNCSCDACSGACGTASKSCTCEGGDGSSVTCRGGYEASCTSCGE